MRCPLCGRLVAVTPGGYLRAHTRPPGVATLSHHYVGRYYCALSWEKAPTEP